MISEQSQAAAVHVLIVYYSRFGAVKELAGRIADGVISLDGAEVDVLEVSDAPLADSQERAALVNRMATADALIVGAPGYFGSMASPVKRLFEDCATASDPPATDDTRPWRHYLFHNKVGAAFTATGTPHGGNEQTLHSILTMLMHFGMIIVTPGQQQPILESDAAPYGATTIAGPGGTPAVTEAEEAWARAHGRRVAEVASWLRTGRSASERHVETRTAARRRGALRPLA